VGTPDLVSPIAKSANSGNSSALEQIAEIRGLLERTVPEIAKHCEYSVRSTDKDVPERMVRTFNYALLAGVDPSCFASRLVPSLLLELVKTCGLELKCEILRLLSKLAAHKSVYETLAWLGAIKVIRQVEAMHSEERYRTAVGELLDVLKARPVKE